MATQSNSFPLATEAPYTGGQDSAAGNPNAGSTADGNTEGAEGVTTDSGGFSQGSMIAIIVVVIVVAILGTSSAILFYVAKKREWKVRDTIRKSARKVKTALTPRRSEFPRYARHPGRIDGVPPTPRLNLEDLEKNGAMTKGPSRMIHINFSRK